MSEKTCMNTIPYVQNLSFFHKRKFWTKALLFRFFSFIKGNSEQKALCSESFFSFWKKKFWTKGLVQIFLFFFKRKFWTKALVFRIFLFFFQRKFWTKGLVFRIFLCLFKREFWTQALLLRIFLFLFKREFWTQALLLRIFLFLFKRQFWTQALLFKFFSLLTNHIWAEVFMCLWDMNFFYKIIFVHGVRWKKLRLHEYDFSFKTWKVAGLDLSK